MSEVCEIATIARTSLVGTRSVQPTVEELEAYLDDALSVARTSAIEAALRTDAALHARLADILRRRESGAHSLAEIWREARASCATRAEWGRYLLGVLDEDHAEYLRAHLEEVGCRACAANVADLRAQHAAGVAPAVAARRGKYFASSAGHLPHGDR